MACKKCGEKIDLRCDKSSPVEPAERRYTIEITETHWSTVKQIMRGVLWGKRELSHKWCNLVEDVEQCMENQS